MSPELLDKYDELITELKGSFDQLKLLEEDGTPFTAPMLAQFRAGIEAAENDLRFRRRREEEREQAKAKQLENARKLVEEADQANPPEAAKGNKPAETAKPKNAAKPESTKRGEAA